MYVTSPKINQDTGYSAKLGGGYVVDLEQVGEQMRLFIMACQVAALKQCVSSI